MKRVKVYCLLIGLSLVILGFKSQNDRPIEWAKPIQLSGVGNLFQVDSFIYRSEQPTAIGMFELEKIGVKSIINLRNLRNDKNELKGKQIIGFQKRINTWTITFDEVVAASIVTGKHISYRDWETDRKSTRLNSSHLKLSRMPSSA